MPSENNGLLGTEAQKKNRLLLALWVLEAEKGDVNGGVLTKQVLRGKEKAGDFQPALEELEKAGAIAFSKKNNRTKVSLSAKGVEMLGEVLRNSEFEFGSQIGPKTANGLLRWMREMGTPTNGAIASGKGVAIASYDEFKQVALDVYGKLNRDFNLDNLVPIYRIRREIGDRVSRSQFNDWMLEMQANDIFQLMGGEMPDITPDKREDSIETPVGGLRYYAKSLNS